MGVGGRVYNNRATFLSGFLDFIDNLALNIGLKEIYLMTFGLCRIFAEYFDVT